MESNSADEWEVSQETHFLELHILTRVRRIYMEWRHVKIGMFHLLSVPFQSYRRPVKIGTKISGGTTRLLDALWSSRFTRSFLYWSVDGNTAFVQRYNAVVSFLIFISLLQLHRYINQLMETLISRGRFFLHFLPMNVFGASYFRSRSQQFKFIVKLLSYFPETEKICFSPVQ